MRRLALRLQLVLLFLKVGQHIAELVVLKLTLEQQSKKMFE